MEMQRIYLYGLHLLDLKFIKEKCFALDYGCGNGDFIKYANKNGYNFRGVDNYYDGNEIALFNNNPIKEYIDVIDNSGTIPFSNKTFNYITSYMVFEHVEHLEAVLCELNRVLCENGTILCSFPLQFSVNEGHFGIPFSHWFEPTNRMRKFWVLLFYKLGFGIGRNENLSFEEWYKKAFKFIDNFCHYRTKNEFLKCCRKAGFEVRFRDKEGLQFRLQNRKGLFIKIIRGLIKLTPNFLVSFLLQKKASAVIELIKTTEK